MAESAAKGTYAGVDLAWGGADTAGTRYAIVSDASGGGFAIDAGMGRITVADGSKLDFEASGKGHGYAVTVSATDGGSPALATSETVVVKVRDVRGNLSANPDTNSHVVGSATPVTGNVLTNDTDTDPSPGLQVKTAVDFQGLYGTVTINRDGSYTYTPKHPSDSNVAEALNRRGPHVEQVLYTAIDTDGVESSSTLTITTLTPPNVTAGHTLAYTENQGAAAIDPAVIVSDSDGNDLKAATARITGNYVKGEDVLAYGGAVSKTSDAQGYRQLTGEGLTNIFVKVDAETGALMFKGNDTHEHYRQVLAAVTYTNTSESPSAATRTVTFTATDEDGLTGQGATGSITVDPVNDAPVLTLPRAQAPSQRGPVVFSSTNHNGIAITDVDANGSTEQVSLEVGGGTLTLSTTSGLRFVDGTSNGGAKLTVQGTLAAINAALDGLHDEHDDSSYPIGSDQLTVTAGDLGNSGNGGSKTASGTVALDILAPFANDDTVFADTSTRSVEIPDLALFLNDLVYVPGKTGVFSVFFREGLDVPSARIVGFSAVSGGTVTHENDRFVFTDDATAGGSFTYTVADKDGRTDTATVMIEGARAFGTNGNEILIGSSVSTSITYAGGAGDDAMVTRSAENTLLAGEGNDLPFAESDGNYSDGRTPLPATRSARASTMPSPTTSSVASNTASPISATRTSTPPPSRPRSRSI